MNAPWPAHQTSFSVTEKYVHRLTQAHGGIAEVWLFGSRATGNARINSDWDYMVFLSDQREFNAICQDRELDQPDIDLFVVVGSKAMRPWSAQDGQNKVLRLNASLGGLNWTPRGVTATYESREECPPVAQALRRSYAFGLRSACTLERRSMPRE